jgi:hypothetical protein
LIDTRNGSGASTSDDGPVGPRSSPGPYDIAIRGFCGVPFGAKAVVLNLTVVAPTQGGDLRVGPTDADPFPVVSAINYPAHVGALANGALVPLAAAPGDDIRLVFAMVAAGSLHILVDVNGYFGAPGSGPLWGHGRPGTMMWGQQLGQFLIPCVNGDYQFGLSQKAVTWEDAAEACPQGTWVCTAAQRGTAACDTARPTSTCDELACDRSCFDRPDNDVVGWLADTQTFYGGLSSRELGGNATDLVQCVEVPVWCCAGT